MTKRIMVLNGSGRVGGNTSALIDAFCKGAEEAGHEVVRFDLGKMTIHPCMGCFGGGKDAASPCVQKDDMDKIYPVYREADVVCFASPLYYWTISGLLKCALDRLFAVVECHDGDTQKPREGVLLMAAEGYKYESCADWFDLVMERMHWTNRGKVLCGGVLERGAIDGNAKLQEAYELGKNL